jgi:hypothetical protein
MEHRIDIAEDAVVDWLGQRAHICAYARGERFTLEERPSSRVRLVERAHLGASIDQTRHEMRSQKPGGASDQDTTSG